ncbi:LacI family DNA-binding transcriptional regulator [Furfurilactobacillus siliginis]|uniref:Glucose-resistance amylase regulator n=1 Tax=Furfurilactobacillus siliginis TaxID=348151 RepID=A0A0R2LA67_9LACO|nr:LacI family DNA-binding transcriptional regulator [Furfurilactobacillus siliginis]KRN96236.1 glucose-resistance amylase regulator [Furfurilactobacillus siliginis]GEK27839.1 LacI family transcriptional regulator [Furfurilactobacillus siliginis]
MTVTIKDVAKAAGVSIATVSRVLAHKVDFYAPETAAQVTKVAKELGYQRNVTAAELATKTSDVLAVIISATKTNFADSIIEGIQDVAFAQGLSVIILYAGENNDDLQHKALTTVIERSVRAILIVALELNEDNRQLLDDSAIPHVFLANASDKNKGLFVASDDFKIGKATTTYFLDQGYTSIGLVGMDRTSYVGRQRINGYLAALKQHDITPGDNWIQGGNFRYEDGVTAMKAYGPKPPVQAVIANSDVSALGVINTAHQFKLDIPSQLAVLSVDGTQLIEMFRPQVTALVQDFAAIGRRGAEMLLKQIPEASQFIDFKIHDGESTK